MSRTKLSSVVSRQIPEFIREDYPTFVAFVEAYYKYLQDQGVDLTAVKDIDQTLEQFIVEFKKELAHNLPAIQGDERFILTKIKDQYLAKGSEASYKLLFRLLFGKKVELTYPGTQMLRASDGRWNQEISVFAKVDFGQPQDIVGKLVDIQTATRLIRVLVDRKEDLVGEVDRIVALGGNIYEFFLDKKFFGILKPTDKIKYKDTFQATILPATQTPKIVQAGKNFRVGQVFEVRSGTGTGALLKVTEVDDNNGIKYAEFIKFGIGYSAGFAVNLLSSNTVNAAQLIVASASSSRSGDNLSIGDRTLGFDEQGYVNLGDYVTYDYVDGTYAGSIIREFSLNFRNAQTSFDDPAIIEVALGALVKYPGYFTSNSGFLDDSIFIQDSKYYQAFSYVIRIDERLDSYKSAVKTMLHPAGMALFGEYNITNNINLSVALESLVKSLGIGIEDTFAIVDTGAITLSFTKVLSDSISTPNDGLFVQVFSKALDDSIDTPTDSFEQLFGKGLSTTYSGMTDSTATLSIGKALATTSVGTLSDLITIIDTDKVLADASVISESLAHTTTKYLEDTDIGTLTEAGKVWMNSYQGQDYYSQEYSVGLEQTFTT
ncbi:hypothetical protein UFOVP909_122 [uncultured Caudovirales phage]|uniref:Baseplate wedge subunit n=1 Tax=uncultured Caudovirales phage TaxID=2100421 RepID=A0A6J5SDC5_9CAUD|nr:hypothetical protein UFOVP909_122 [uncultured Caudovirales phage]CAB4182130.1 hypothetical protein UFOVP1066_149 [uncultured Caudovirales phage]CAB4198637.1 hypothetical protein UFOVP1315_188 [uncultured Caudovirales phage]CAB4211542.1 hypothetical protein UFOVP1421_149 [uncultured Caudovirales phage]CAB5238655.1 hypothetical protein UFOVP1525_159 [uncultured Caudovirales phage]